MDRLLSLWKRASDSRGLVLIALVLDIIGRGQVARDLWTWIPSWTFQIVAYALLFVAIWRLAPSRDRSNSGASGSARASRSSVPGLGERVRRRRTDLGLSQQKLAAVCTKRGVPLDAAKIERVENKSIADAGTIVAIAKALQVSSD